MLFSPFGELVRIDMKRNYAFVQFKTVEEAMRAKDATNGGKLDQSEITVEFVARRMGEGGGGGGRGGGDRDDRRGSGGGGGGGGRRYDDRGEFHNISSCGMGESLQGMYRFVFFSQQ
jgi:arginine/serine-rich splicing factor 4/5/6